MEISVDGSLQTVSGTSPYRATYDFLFHPGPSALIDVLAIDEDGRRAVLQATVDVAQPPSFRITPQRALGNGFSADGYDVGDVTGDGVPDVVAGGNPRTGFDIDVHEGELAVQRSRRGDTERPPRRSDDRAVGS